MKWMNLRVSIPLISALVLSASAQDAVLTWNNQETLEGRLTSASETTLTWDLADFRRTDRGCDRSFGGVFAGNRPW